MLEEIGTGGAGFRYMYAAFLQEAATVTGESRLNECSAAMTEAGDMWRHLAVEGARLFKKRAGVSLSFDVTLSLIALEYRRQTRKQLFRTLKKFINK